MWEHDVVHNELEEMAQKGKGADLEQFIEFPAELTLEELDVEKVLALERRYLAVQERIENNLKILREYLRLQMKGDEGGTSGTRSNEDVADDMSDYREIIADVVGTYQTMRWEKMRFQPMEGLKVQSQVMHLCTIWD